MAWNLQCAVKWQERFAFLSMFALTVYVITVLAFSNDWAELSNEVSH